MHEQRKGKVMDQWGKWAAWVKRGIFSSLLPFPSTWESSTFSFMYLRHPEPQSWRKEGSNWKKSQGLEKKGQSNFNEDIQLFLFKVICCLNSNVASQVKNSCAMFTRSKSHWVCRCVPWISNWALHIFPNRCLPLSFHAINVKILSHRKRNVTCSKTNERVKITLFFPYTLCSLESWNEMAETQPLRSLQVW